MQALDALGRSATAAEVASKAGLPIQETERYLQGLASEGEGSMKVRIDDCYRHRTFRPVATSQRLLPPFHLLNQFKATV